MVSKAQNEIGISAKSYGGTEEESYDLDDLQNKLTELSQEILVLSAVKHDISKFKHVNFFLLLHKFMTYFWIGLICLLETEKIHLIKDQTPSSNKKNKEDNSTYEYTSHWCKLNPSSNSSYCAIDRAFAKENSRQKRLKAKPAKLPSIFKTKRGKKASSSNILTNSWSTGNSQKA